MHCSRDWSCTDHVTDHAPITWLIMHRSRTWSCTYHLADHALNTWLIIHCSRNWSCTDHVTGVQTCALPIWPHGRQPTRPRSPWGSPGKNTGVGCHVLLQCMKVKCESEVAQSCPTLSDPMDCSLPGSSVHEIFQARVLEWGAIAFSDTLTSAHYLVLQSL